MRNSKRLIIAVAIVAPLLIAVAAVLHSFIRARTTSASNACINNLRQIDGATQQWALQHNATSNSVVTWKDLLPNLGRGQASDIPRCPQGGIYTIGRVADAPRCSLMRHNLDFGRVTVLDESGTSLADARVGVLDQGGEIGATQTSTNGEAYFFDDWRSGLWDNVVTNSWSDGTKRVTAWKEGYHTSSVALPTCDWPVKFILKKQAE
jgi:hypothetical protein